MNKITKYVVLDILRNKILVAYTVLMFLVSFSAFNLDNESSRGIITLLNLILIIVPLMSIIFSTIYIYNSTEFIELLVTQPISRSTIWLNLMLGLMFSLTLALITGVGIPIFIFNNSPAALSLLLAGVFLTIIFVALALLAAVYTRDKARGIGTGILLWLYFTVLYDGLVLFFLFQFSDYPMEYPMLIFTTLNPVDLARILVLLKLDISALMGYTGAVFKEYFHSDSGYILSLLVLLIWAIIPSVLAVRKFNNKDL